jgi:cob(I)alamin adenosyltransferase
MAEGTGQGKPIKESSPGAGQHATARRRRHAVVTTRTGDDGYTDLLGKERVPKWDPRPEAYGTLDEASSALGLARALARSGPINDMLIAVQKELYLLMAELATGPEEYERSPLKLTAEHVAALEERADSLKGQVEIGVQFILPGETAAGAAIDLARTIVRRGERLAARLYHEGLVKNQEVLRYLNRLSDLLFILARYEEAQEGHASQGTNG